MTSFEPVLQGPAPNFQSYTLADPSLSQEENARNFFVSQLRLFPGNSFSVRLKDPPFTPISPSIITPARARAFNALDTFVVVSSDQPNIVEVEQKFTSIDQFIYEIKAKTLTGAALVRARRLSDQKSLAEMRVTVSEKPEKEGMDFFIGFKEGLESSESGQKLLLKISDDPLAFSRGVHVGCLRGLVAGLVSLLELLRDLLKLAIAVSPYGMIHYTIEYIYEPAFRQEVKNHVAQARKVAEALVLIIPEVQIHSEEYLGFLHTNGRPVGRIVGQEIGKSVNEELTKRSIAQIGEWVGFVIGRVMFEIVLLMLTEGMGIAASSAKVSGEGAGLAARLAPKLESVLAGLAKLKALLRARLGARAVGETTEVLKAVEALAETIRPRATVAQLRQMLAQPNGLYVWGTFDKEVAANELIRSTGRTNIHEERVVFLLKGRKGLEGVTYGPFKVVIDENKVRGVREIRGRSEEFCVPEIGETEGLWFTQEDVLAAMQGLRR